MHSTMLIGANVNINNISSKNNNSKNSDNVYMSVVCEHKIQQTTTQKEILHCYQSLPVGSVVSKEQAAGPTPPSFFAITQTS